MTIKQKPSNYAILQNDRSGGNLNSNSIFDDLKSAGIRIPRDWNILDIGCRTLLTLNKFWKDGYSSIYGVDIGIQAENSWKGSEYSQNLKRVDIHDGIPFNVKFDLITCSHTLEHCYDPEKVRDVIDGSLKSGGYLHCIVPIEDESNFVKYPYHIIRFDDHVEHMAFFEQIGYTVCYQRCRGGNSVVIFKK